MSRLPSTLRVPDPRGPVADVSGLQGRGFAEAAFRLRGTVEHACEVVLRSADECRRRLGRVRRMRRPARSGLLQHELGATAPRVPPPQLPALFRRPADRPRAGMARLRPCNVPRHRQRLRHAAAPTLPARPITPSHLAVACRRIRSDTSAPAFPRTGRIEASTVRDLRLPRPPRNATRQRHPESGVRTSLRRP